MSRCVVNVATGRYVRGQERLRKAVGDQAAFMCWTDEMPPGSPSHADVPYAFKPWAMWAALEAGFTTLLWADASILPVAPLEPLFQKIEREGCWISKNGYRNSEWTCEDAYPLLGVTHEENHKIEHVVATAFGVSLDHPVGTQIFSEYYRLAQNGSFRGPWKGGVGVQHRHDQTALSVTAWRAGVKLTDPPQWIAYSPGEVEGTILAVNSNY